MKKFRKGFTLVELLIVIAILGILSTAMSASIGNGTSSAKASTIAANFDTCITAAKLYYAENLTVDLTSTTAVAFLETVTTYVPNWGKFKENGNIIYCVDEKDSGTGHDKWAVQVDFSSAPDKDAIATALKKIKGYDDTNDATNIDAGMFKVTLLTGAIGAYVAQD